MRSLMTLLALVFTESAMAADSSNFQLRDAADLVRVCSVGPDDPAHAHAVGFCHGILVGAFRYYESSVTGANRFICTDPDADAHQSHERLRGVGRHALR
jgi:hypothetical protein